MKLEAKRWRFLCHFFVITIACTSAFAQKQACSNRQTNAQIAKHIDHLIGQMTLSERIAQLGDRAPAISRLGLPAYNWWNEGLHGIARNGYATVFPQAIGLAATWDASLLHDVGDVVSTEARAKFSAHAHGDSPRYGGLTIWSPNINIFRDPRWGRGQETYGEDPFLTATLAGQFVEGLQGNDPFYFKTQATAKHFVAHSGPEQGRDGFNSVVSAHDLADTYLPAFHSLVTKAQVAALMCSYNAINSVPSCANDGLLGRTVSSRWRFAGYVVSDCDAVGNIAEYQHYTSDAAHGAAAALKAGVDLDCGNSYAALEPALTQHLVTEGEINESLHRLLQARLQLGLFDPEGCTPYDAITEADDDTPEHRALALRAAEESIVLLRNDATLPLKSAQSIAVIGPTADMLKVLEANYHGTASQPITPLDGLMQAFSTVRYSQGSLLAAGVAAPIPRSALRTGSASDSPQGLKAEYFANDIFANDPAVSTVVPKIDFDLDRVSPSPLLPSKRYSARWTGYMMPPAAGDYVLHVNIERCWDCSTHDQFRLLLDGKTLLDNDGMKAEPNRATLHFADTAPHALTLELAHTGDDEGIALEWEPPAEAQLKEAVAAAKASDVVVAFVGLSPDLEGEALQLQLDGFAGGDRTSLDLPAAQRTLLTRLQELHKPTVIVLTSGSAVALGSEASGANAILEAWYPGEEGGDALANIITGKVNPSGRLPLTFYRTVADLPAFTDYSMAHRTYRYFDGPVLYPFGFGLSYAHFNYGAVTLSSKRLVAGRAIKATVMVTNSSAIAGTEVAELYLVPPRRAGAPRLTLAGIERISLAAGESRTIHFTLDAELSTVDAAGRRAVRPGVYRILIAGTQPDPAATGASFHIVASQGRKPSSKDQDDSGPGLLSASFTINSPKSEFAHANHGRVKRLQSSLK